MSSAGYGKYIKSVVHRDIKMKNIGIKKDADGAVSLRNEIFVIQLIVTFWFLKKT